MSEQEPHAPEQRTWLGMPINWDWRHWYKGVWNADDHRLFPPRRLGIGWSINLRELLRRTRIMR